MKYVLMIVLLTTIPVFAKEPTGKRRSLAAITVVYGDRTTVFQVFMGPGAGRIQVLNNAGLNREKVIKKSDAEFVVAKLENLSSGKSDKSKCIRRYIEISSNKNLHSYCFEDPSPPAADARALANLMSALF